MQALGLDLLSDCIRALQPSHIVNLCTENPNKNVPQGPFWAESSLGLGTSLSGEPGAIDASEPGWQPRVMELLGIKEASLMEQDPCETRVTPPPPLPPSHSPTPLPPPPGGGDLPQTPSFPVTLHL